MRIAISITAGGTEGKVSGRFGRCPFFMIYDIESGEYEVIPNPATAMSGGAGSKAAEIIIEKDCEAIISGNIGPNAYRALKAANVKMYTAQDGSNIEETIEKFKNGELEEFGMNEF